MIINKNMTSITNSKYTIYEINQSLKFIFVLILSIIVSLGCSMKENLDEMHDATVQMKTKTEDLSKSTNEMKETTRKVKDLSEQLSQKTNELYDDMRHGDSETKRREIVKDIQNFKSPAAKLSLAAKYFMSFEYQLWGLRGFDTEEKREQMATLAVREFFFEIQELILDSDYEVDPLTDKDPIASLNAIAATLDILDLKQERLLSKNPEIKKLSMLDMIQEALLYNFQIKHSGVSSVEYKSYHAEVLKNEQLASFLLKVRVNILPTLIIASITDLAKSNLTAIKMYLFRWDLDVSRFNVVQLNFYTTYLRNAVSDYEFLNSIGESGALVSTLRKLYKANLISDNVNISDIKLVKARDEFSKVFNKIPHMK